MAFTTFADKIPPWSLPALDANFAICVQAVDTIALLKAFLIPTSAITVIVRGYTTVGDGGGGFYWWNAADSTADNGGTVIQLNSGGAGRFNKLF